MFLTHTHALSPQAGIPSPILSSTAVQTRNAVTAHFSSEQLPPFGSAERTAAQPHLVAEGIISVVTGYD